MECRMWFPREAKEFGESWIRLIELCVKHGAGLGHARKVPDFGFVGKEGEGRTDVYIPLEGFPGLGLKIRNVSFDGRGELELKVLVERRRIEAAPPLEQWSKIRMGKGQWMEKGEVNGTKISDALSKAARGRSAEEEDGVFSDAPSGASMAAQLLSKRKVKPVEVKKHRKGWSWRKHFSIEVAFCKVRVGVEKEKELVSICLEHYDLTLLEEFLSEAFPVQSLCIGGKDGGSYPAMVLAEWQESVE